MKVFLGVGTCFPHVLDRLLRVRPQLHLDDVHAVHASLPQMEKQKILVLHGIHNHWVVQDCELEPKIMVEQEDVCILEGGEEDVRILAALNRLAGGGHFCHVEYGIVVTHVRSSPHPVSSAVKTA